MRILCCLSLLLVALHATVPADDPKPNEVKGLKLPAEVPVAADDGYTRITPTFDQADKVLDVRWIVLGTGKTAPKYDPLGTGKDSSLIVSVPRAADEQILVYAVAMLQGEKGPWLTEPALTVIKTTGPPTTPTPGGPTPPAPDPTDADVEAAIKKAKGLHVFLIYDVNAADRALAQLTSSSNVVAKLQNGGAAWHEYDYRAKEVKAANLANKFQAGQLPVLIVLDGNKKPAPVLAVTPLKLTGSLAKDEALVLSAFAKAVK